MPVLAAVWYLGYLVLAVADARAAREVELLFLSVAVMLWVILRVRHHRGGDDS